MTFSAIILYFELFLYQQKKEIMRVCFPPRFLPIRVDGE